MRPLCNLWDDPRIYINNSSSFTQLLVLKHNKNYEK